MNTLRCVDRNPLKDSAMIEELVRLLNEIVKGPELRHGLIADFKTVVANHEPTICNEAVDGVLRDLAYDLAYYEPDPVLRREDSSFYGDDRARTEIREALQKLAQRGVNVGK
jgi:hypothetical protein